MSKGELIALVKFAEEFCGGTHHKFSVILSSWRSSEQYQLWCYSPNEPK